jgi:hypothetical protein
MFARLLHATHKADSLLRVCVKLLIYSITRFRIASKLTNHSVSNICFTKSLAKVSFVLNIISLMYGPLTVQVCTGSVHGHR